MKKRKQERSRREEEKEERSRRKEKNEGTNPVCVYVNKSQMTTTVF